MSNEPQAVLLDDAETSPVAPGIVRRALPSSGQVLVRAFDLEAGISWPEADAHDRDELIAGRGLACTRLGRVLILG
jgi:hypothetical protein